MSRNRHPSKKQPGISLLKRIKRLFLYGFVIAFLVSITLVGLLRFVPAYTSAFMLQDHVEDLVSGNGYRAIDQRWVSRSEISKYAFAAVIASEDQRFYRHHGIDFDAVYKAYKQHMNGGKLRGASTISQQVAKNLFLTSSKSFVRKALEVWFTLLIESLWSKHRILEMYLNIAEFGDHLYGIEAASRHYFHIPAKRLSARQAALLAATLPNPAILRAERPSPYLLRRQNWILGQMRNLNY